MPTSARKSWSESAAPLSDSAAHTAASRASFSRSFSSVSSLGHPDLEAHRLELAGDLLHLLVCKLLLGREQLELGGLDPTALLGAFDDAAQLLGLE